MIASVTEFLSVWALGGKASLNLTTSNGFATVGFDCTLGHPGAPNSIPDFFPPPFPPPTSPPSRPRHQGPAECEKTRLRAAQHQATQAQTSAPASTAPMTSVGKSPEQSAAEHREISKIKSKGGLDNRKTNYLSKDKQPKESSGIIFQCKAARTLSKLAMI